MNKFLMFFVLFTSLSAVAVDERESHGNPEDEKKCFKEIRSLSCGKPENHATFVRCVDQRIAELTPACQVFHREEVERMKGHNESH